jgi:regulator of protease activity HflC (stomatin/prohibitin superfamily)
MLNKKAQEGNGGIIATLFVIAFIVGAILLFMTFETVPAGHVGVKDTFGVVEDGELQPGFYVLNPFTSVKSFSTQINKETYENVGISKDSQEVTTEVVLNYRVQADRASDLYKDVGRDFVDIIAQPIVVAVSKSYMAKYSADQFAENWETMKTSIATEITERLSNSGITVTEVSVTDFDFKPEFQASIEAKQRAAQDALRAVSEKQTTITQSEARAQQTKNEVDANAYKIEQEAEAQAYALRLIREELSKSKELVQYKAVEQWNGQLPTYVTSSDGNMLFNLPVQ